MYAIRLVVCVCNKVSGVCAIRLVVCVCNKVSGVCMQ